MQPELSNVPASKANLKAWWNHFTFAQKVKKEDEGETGPPVFGKPLRNCLKYASVQISTVDAKGERYVWGYVPAVVAKCGLYLKDNATEVAGTFRVNGSSKRMRELQAKFDSPPKYGKDIDWTKEMYTPHDVASVFRRYLTQMPEPVIPHDMYNQFRDALTRHSRSRQEITTTYQRFIRELPRPNRYLLLYVLDLLSVFARKSDKNLMTAGNLAVIFQPGIISHPNHEMSPADLSISQQVLEFLILEQDSLIMDIPHQSNHSVPSRTFSEVEEPIGSGDDGELEGSWRLIDQEHRPSIPRRRTTTMDSSESRNVVSEVMTLPSFNPAGVQRSYTLPSRRRSSEGEEHRSRVLRKQKRASAVSAQQNGMIDKPRTVT